MVFSFWTQQSIVSTQASDRTLFKCSPDSTGIAWIINPSKHFFNTFIAAIFVRELIPTNIS